MPIHVSLSDSWCKCLYTQRNVFEIVLNQPEIRLYLPFSDWLRTENERVHLVPNQSENGKHNLISGWFNEISKRFLCVKVDKGLMRAHLHDEGLVGVRPVLDAVAPEPLLCVVQKNYYKIYWLQILINIINESNY